MLHTYICIYVVNGNSRIIKFYNFHSSSPCPTHPCDKNSFPSFSKLAPWWWCLTLHVKVSHCFPFSGKMYHFLKKETNPIQEPNEVRKSHILRHWCFFADTRCDFSYNLAPCLQPTYLKTHDCNTEVLLSILPCTLKHNYARLKYAKHCLRKKYKLKIEKKPSL